MVRCIVNLANEVVKMDQNWRAEMENLISGLNGEGERSTSLFSPAFFLFIPKLYRFNSLT